MLRVARGAYRHAEPGFSRSPGHSGAQHGIASCSHSCFANSPSRLACSYLHSLSTSSNLASKSRCDPIAKSHRSDALRFTFCRTQYSTNSGPTTTINNDARMRFDRSETYTKAENASSEAVQEKFRRLGLNTNISRQIALTHPHIRQPTQAQTALIPAILSPTDVILRAHTGTGKSFGILLALLSKPRIVFSEPTSQDTQSSLPSAWSKRNKPQTGIASLILVPSNELALQYMRWARSLFPRSVLPSLEPVIQCLVRGALPGTEAPTIQEEVERLKASPPHILIGTPGRIKDILDSPAGSSLLGLDTLRTLVLDEADAVLQLPGRFPSQKQRWKHEVHKAPGLLVLNEIMKRRPTFSGGEKHLSAGLENRPGKKRDERRPPEHIRRNLYKAAEQSAANSTDTKTGLALAKPRCAGAQPLQLVATSATANSVMRHFFAARTGWLRTGAKESGMAFSPQVGRWIDLTGLSGKSMVEQGIRGLFGAKKLSQADSLIQSSIEQTPSTMPASIEHTCVVVDEAPLSRQLSAIPLRNFEPRLARKKDSSTITASSDATFSPETAAGGALGDDFFVIKPEDEPQEHEMDQTLIEALAFCFASEGVDRGLALIPARWSLLRMRAALEALGVTVRLASDVGAWPDATPAAAQVGNNAPTSAAAVNPELFLLQATSSRGLDIPSLSHVFLVGYASVIDAVQYVHSAGRVARVGGDPDKPATGKVVTLLRGLPHHSPMPTDVQDQSRSSQAKLAISTSEAKMANVYRRLGVVPKRFDLGLLSSGVAATSENQTTLKQSESIAEDTQVKSADTEEANNDEQILQSS